MTEPTAAAVGIGIFAQVVAAILTVAVTGLLGWVYSINSRVTTLEAERSKIVELEKLFTIQHESLKELINVKFAHMHALINASLRRDADEQDLPSHYR